MYKGYIYRHWIVNDKGIEKSYIGKTTQKPNRRWKSGKVYVNKFGNAIRKYGWNNFNHEIIGVVESDSKYQLNLDLNEWEKYYIDKYDSFYNGYNSTLGGEGTVGYTYVQSEEHKRKNKETHIGKKHTDASKLKMSKNHCDISGAKNPRARKVVCVETGQTFDTIKEANQWIGKGDISKCLRGKNETAGGYHWQYVSKVG